MFFSYFEKGYGELCFGANCHPFRVIYSALIPEIFMIGFN